MINVEDGGGSGLVVGGIEVLHVLSGCQPENGQGEEGCDGEGDGEVEEGQAGAVDVRHGIGSHAQRRGQPMDPSDAEAHEKGGEEADRQPCRQLDRQHFLESLEHFFQATGQHLVQIFHCVHPCRS